MMSCATKRCCRSIISTPLKKRKRLSTILALPPLAISASRNNYFEKRQYKSPPAFSSAFQRRKRVQQRPDNALLIVYDAVSLHDDSSVNAESRPETSARAAYLYCLKYVSKAIVPRITVIHYKF